MEGITGKRAIVTGGGSGIGRDIALRLSELGAEVFIVGRTKETLDQAVKDSNNKITAFQLDISNWQKTKEVVQNILPLQLVVNNAGQAQPHSVLEATEDEFDALMNINVKAAMNITQTVTKDLVAKGLSGRVVNISSVAGQRVYNDLFVYSMTKASMDMMTKFFATELGSKNIRVNAVSPTIVMTPLGKRLWSDPKKSDPVLDRIPMGRFAETKDVVNAVIFLLSDQSDMITGHVVPVDGGSLTH